MDLKIIALVLILAGTAYGADLTLGGEASAYLNEGGYSYCDDGALGRSVLNVLEDKPGQLFYPPYQWRGGRMEYLPVDIRFGQTASIDQVRFVFGNFNDLTNLTGIKYSYVPAEGKKMVAGFRPFTGKDARQIFAMNIEAVSFRFELMTDGNPGPQAVISEVSFLRNGRPCRFENISELKKKVMENFQARQNDRLLAALGSIHEMGFSSQAGTKLSSWGKFGVNTSDVKVFPYKHGFALHLEFTSDGTNSGKILAGQWKGKIVKGSPSTLGDATYHFATSIPLGEWKIDEDGHLCVKIGNGEWKKEKKRFLSFSGTELEDVEKVSPVNFWGK